MLSQPGVPSILLIQKNLGYIENEERSLPEPYTLSIVPLPAETTRVVANPCFTLIDKLSPPGVFPDVEAVDKEDDTIRVRPPTGSKDQKRSVSSSHKKTGKTSGNATGKKVEVEDDVVDDAEQANDASETVRRSRWVVPANGSVTCYVRFASPSAGQFDQTLTFETLNTRRQYPFYVRGICRFPRLDNDPKVLFPKVVTKKTLNDNMQQVYVPETNMFEFGPVLCGMSRDDYKGERFKRNVAKFTLQNPTGLDIHVTASLENDTAFTTFALDTPSFVVPANSSKQLRIWAYPKTQLIYEDQVVVCVKDAPEPIVFGIRCEGVEPIVELEKKAMTFDRLLIHRKDSRYVTIYNKSKLAVAWSLHGLDQLGEDFSAPATKGVIEPLSAYKLGLVFKSSKPMSIKKVNFVACSHFAHSLFIASINSI